jgi:putative ATP-dependent endonuclease of OLD family
LEQAGISVVPVCGVDFSSVSKLFGGKGLHVRLSVVTDGDAGTERAESPDNSSWQTRLPKLNAAGKPAVCARVVKTIDDYKANDFVGIFH